jgi:hypothetical protein
LARDIGSEDVIEAAISPNTTITCWMGVVAACCCAWPTTDNAARAARVSIREFVTVLIWFLDFQEGLAQERYAPAHKV